MLPILSRALRRKYQMVYTYNGEYQSGGLVSRASTPGQVEAVLRRACRRLAAVWLLDPRCCPAVALPSRCGRACLTRSWWACSSSTS